MAADQEKRIAEAEELLGDQLHRQGFGKGLYFGQYLGGKLPPYPKLGGDAEVDRRVQELRTFCEETIDPVTIDAEEEIPPEVVQGLGKLGVLGACLPKSCRGSGYSP